MSTALGELDPRAAEALLPVIRARKAELRLLDYVRQAWPIVEPTTPLLEGRHLEAVCEHLEAVVRGQITQLLITIPPGTGKSTAVSVLFASWLWIEHPSWRLMFASYGMDLSTRDSRKCRAIIESDWYQTRWGERFALTSDQNVKTWFENDRTGHRVATSVGGAAHGKRATLLVCDDLQKADIMYADAEARRRARLVFEGWWDNVWVRGLDPEPLGAKIVIAHRLTNDDGVDYLMGQGGWESLCLPQEFEPERRCVTSIGWQDWRTEPGELLFPELYTREKVETEFKPNVIAWAAQHQQKPAPPGGKMYQREWFEIVPAAPAKPEGIVRYWDKAGTQGGGAYSAGVEMSKKGGVFYIEHVERGQWGSTNRNAVIRQTAALDGVGVTIWIEQEPGSGGKESAEISVQELAGYDVHIEAVSGSKEARGAPMAAQAKVGNVKLVKDTPEDPWNRDFLNEVVTFPFGRYKDQADAAHGAFNKLALAPPKRRATWGSGRPI